MTTKSYKELLPQIKTFVFDCDGVFTDSSVILLPGGEQARTMNVRDGLAVQKAVNNGFNVVIITGGRSTLVRERFVGLGVRDVFLKVSKKLELLERLVEEREWNWNEIAYMGDDLPDHGPMQKVGLAVCPRNSAPEILQIAKYISPIDGGKGCVRDLVEQTMRVQNKWHIEDEASI